MSRYNRKIYQNLLLFLYKKYFIQKLKNIKSNNISVFIQFSWFFSNKTTIFFFNSPLTTFYLHTYTFTFFEVI